MQLNETHDPNLRSWVGTANVDGGDFPIQNLPFGVFRRRGDEPRGCVAIGDCALDLKPLLDAGLLSGEAEHAARAASEPSLNSLMSMGHQPASALRAQLSVLLRIDSSKRDKILALGALIPSDQIELLLPARVGGFTDFLSSLSHTSRMGRGNLPPAFKHLPIAYNGRASSVRISGEPVLRPYGQYRDAAGELKFGPDPFLDFELEFAAFVGTGNELGSRIEIDKAPDHLFGYCLLNDWSSRGIQFWESTPLGPFLGKSFSTTIAQWVVTAEALAPFRAAPDRKTDAPEQFSHLQDAADSAEGSFAIELTALILTPSMRKLDHKPAKITITHLRNMYWTFAQMLAHHTSNGCNLCPGDLIASGTVSGPDDESRACLAEINERGIKSLTLPNGESRLWLQDGDEIILRGRASRPGYVSIGFGECRAMIASSHDLGNSRRATS